MEIKSAALIALNNLITDKVQQMKDYEAEHFDTLHDYRTLYGYATGYENPQAYEQMLAAEYSEKKPIIQGYIELGRELTALMTQREQAEVNYVRSLPPG